VTNNSIHDNADSTPTVRTQSSPNGTRPNSTRLAGQDLVTVDLEGAPRPDAEMNAGQHVVRLDAGDRPPDLGAAERAAADFLTALGIDLDREGRRATPARMARAFADLISAQPFRLTTFPNDEGYDELVLARAIPFRALCEHHMLLFSGVAHVGYLPGERILGLSKLARLVEHFAAEPQTQERLTMQVAECLDANLRPRGVGVVLEAEHACMTQRGIRSIGATTVTSALLGTLRTDSRSRAEFFALARVPTSSGPR
jgi:GTP cyclohydrolase IA